MTAEDEPPRRARGSEAFFGRRQGKPVRSTAAAARERLMPERLLDLSRLPPPDLKSLFPTEVDAVRLEIGFGAGEHLLDEARRKPETGFIGVEPFVNGMARFLLALAEDPLPNIRIYDDDAVRVLDWLPNASIEAVDLLYPDPWPKRKHWKRRFISVANLDRFARVMKPGARFRFASDIAHYVDWTLVHMHDHPDFSWDVRQASDWREPYPYWRSTRYEAKALAQHRTPAYLTFRRLG